MGKTETISDLEPKQEQLIFALLQEDTKTKAAEVAGVPKTTMYRWFADSRFMAAYRAARRQIFDEALTVLEKGSVKAAQALVDELGERKTGCPVLVSAATRVLDRAFKAMETIEVNEELASLRAIINELRSGIIATTVHARSETPERESESDQAEAASLRAEWMGEIGHSAADIASSLRFNRPQSTVEERHLLELVRQLLAAESVFSSGAPAA